jgi:hypothetical protein
VRPGQPRVPLEQAQRGFFRASWWSTPWRGSADILKERTIGIEVFGQPTCYDPSDNATVRVRAGEVRKRLGSIIPPTAPPTRCVLSCAREPTFPNSTSQISARAEPAHAGTAIAAAIGFDILGRGPTGDHHGGPVLGARAARFFWPQCRRAYGVRIG